MYRNTPVSAVIVAAGSGKRMGGSISKQYIKLGGLSLLARAAAAFEASPLVDHIIVVVKAGDQDFCRREILDPLGLKKLLAVVPGGRERLDSVIAGSACLPEDTGCVLIHDGARPFVTQAVIEEAVKQAMEHGAAVPAVPVKDTIKVTASSPEGALALSTPDRSSLMAVQTPQTFRRDVFDAMYRDLPPDAAVTDDASLAEARGFKVYLTEGDEMNIKITTPSDLLTAEAYLKQQEHALPRTGLGYDVHAFAEGRRLILGGVDIPHTRGLLGHSDADVLIHAIMDALLGAAGLGDIGQHFPDSDPAYKGISSLLLLEKTGALLAEAGYRIVNIDATVIAQRPKIASYIPDMKKNITQVLKISGAQINIKGTTTEKLGFAGREEGIASEAVAVII